MQATYGSIQETDEILDITDTPTPTDTSNTPDTENTLIVKKTYPVFLCIRTEDPNNILVLSPSLRQCVFGTFLITFLPFIAAIVLGLAALLDLLFAYIFHTHGMFGEFTDAYTISDWLALFMSSFIIVAGFTLGGILILGICVGCYHMYTKIHHEIETNRVEDENNPRIGG